MTKAVFAATDEGDKGAGPLFDMTKVTRSTPVDLPSPDSSDRPTFEQPLNSG